MSAIDQPVRIRLLIAFLLTSHGAIASGDVLLPQDWGDFSSGVNGTYALNAAVSDEFSSPTLPLEQTRSIIHEGVSCATTYDLWCSETAVFNVSAVHIRDTIEPSYVSNNVQVGFLLSSNLPYEISGQYVVDGWAQIRVFALLRDETTSTQVYFFDRFIPNNIEDPAAYLTGLGLAGTLQAGHYYTWFFYMTQWTTIPTLGSTAEGFINLQVGELPCPTDLTGDGQTNLADLATLLSEFGCDSQCSADLDSDGVVGLADLAMLLSHFGTDCP